MNGVIITALVILLVAVIGLAFGMMTIHEESTQQIHDLKRKITELEGVKAENCRLESENIQIMAEVTDLIASVIDQRTSDEARLNGMIKRIEDLNRQFARLSDATIGTGDPAEFLRMKNTVYMDLAPRLKFLEGIVGVPHIEYRTVHEGLITKSEPQQEEKE